MKSVKTRTALLLMTAAISFTSCTHENFGPSAKEIISDKKWSVAYFYTTQDKTDNYRNLQLNFKTGGTLNCKQGASAINGTWGMIKDVDRNDVLSITLNSLEPNVTDLSDQWTVTEASSDLIVMQDTHHAILRLQKQ